MPACWRRPSVQWRPTMSSARAPAKQIHQSPQSLAATSCWKKSGEAASVWANAEVAAPAKSNPKTAEQRIIGIGRNPDRAVGYSPAVQGGDDAGQGREAGGRVRGTAKSTLMFCSICRVNLSIFIRARYILSESQTRCCLFPSRLSASPVGHTKQPDLQGRPG